MASVPHVALVGRPNVGKSTLFNRLIGKRQAVVADIAGTTRDRLLYRMEWGGKPFDLIDMAGLEPAIHKDTEITKGTQAQVEKALESAAVLVWVVDAAQGALAADAQIAALLRGLKKPVIVAVNKTDHGSHDIRQYEFSQYGFTPMIPVSALHGRGVDELLDAMAEALPEGVAESEPDERELRLSIVGRPNVGKSTLLNALAGEDRSVVSAEAGTTRDAVDTVIPAEQLFGKTFTKWKTVRIIDTAGIRRRGKIGTSIESWSIIRTLDTIDQSEVALLLLDATEGLVHQDTQVAQKIVDSGKALILLINKWDAVLGTKNIIPTTPEDGEEQEKFLDLLRAELPFLHWVQVLFLSAKEKINLDVLGKLVVNAYTAWNLNVQQEELDELTVKLRGMPRLKNLQSITFEHNRPPVFHLHVEGRQLPHFSTTRYVENVLRDYLQIGPTLIKIWTVTSLKKKK